MSNRPLLRGSALGLLIRWATKNKKLQYAEERPGFQLPDEWHEVMHRVATGAGAATTAAADPDHKEDFDAAPEPPRLSTSSSVADIENQRRPATVDREEMAEKAEDGPEGKGADRAASSLASNAPSRAPSRRGSSSSSDSVHPEGPLPETAALEKAVSRPIVPSTTRDGAVLVTWYRTDDPDNPQNWGRGKKLAVNAIICIYTFVVYMSSAIYTTSEQGLMAEFGVSQIAASLGLALFVLGYGTGPLLFSPLSEIPSIGRNPVYAVTMFLFVIISIPTAVPHNFAGFLVLRFLQGFFGSPCLASGGASLGDIYEFAVYPYALMSWVSAAYCGPALGPLLSGFAVPVLGWKWSLEEIIWASIPVLVVMVALLPETAAPTILYYRARRLRRLTGNPRFQSQSELDQRNLTASSIAVSALIKPLEITVKDPAVLFVMVYTAIIYGIYYSFFEVFPLVYPVYYGMNAGEVGLVFTCILVSSIIGVAIYYAYLRWYMDPRIAARGWPVQEARLVPAIFASVGPTVGLFIFAWTADARFPWIASVIGITIYGATGFVVMQCIFIYLALAYVKYQASLFAANDFFRSAMACGSIVFSQPLFHNLGVARGTSLLGGLSVIGVLGMVALYYWGAKLRSMSKFAEA